MSLAPDETLVFALDADNRQLRHVREGKTGQNCNRICPGCGERLEAVNAESRVYKKRPHFRHLEGQGRRQCAMASIKAAVVEALAKSGSISLPIITPGPKLFPDEADGIERVSFESAMVDDFTDALLKLPDGSELRIWVEARDTRAVDEDGLFDLTLFIPPEKLASLQSIEHLRRYLTLDPSAWRWCRRQTRPSLIEEPRYPLPEPMPSVAPTPPPPPSRPAAPVWTPPPVAIDVQPSAAPTTDPEFNGARKLPELRFEEADGSVTVFHRWRWPNGVMTEQVERLRLK